jgi:hypothetical protein
MLKLKDGGIYKARNGKTYGPMIYHKRLSGYNYSYCAGIWDSWGCYYKQKHETLDFIEVVYEPSDTKKDPIAHMFETERKFVGGKVCDSVYVKLNGSHSKRIRMYKSIEYADPNASWKIENENAIYVNADGARLLAATLLAAADELDKR